jgi:HEPN domain-containing protein
MAQQAAELAIKAIYRHEGWTFAFVHDIRYLLDGLERNGRVVPSGIRESERLTVFASQMRYPGASGFTTEIEHRKLLAIAGETVTWANSIIDTDKPQG